MVSKSISKQRSDYLKKMDEYIERLENLPPDEAKREARESLIRSGVLDKNGNAKKRICTQ